MTAAYVSQDVVLALTEPDVSRVAVSQGVILMLSSPVPPVYATQAALEILAGRPVGTRNFQDTISLL
ncbi:hypothetical protein [Malikia spinosa]|uniref:hypothetical protein n=1 Tax=Malikia spinosa TaxID=86180 RepID=UPI002FDB1F04